MNIDLTSLKMPPPRPPWTPQQEAVFERTRSTKDSLLVTAVAGSGKTTTLVELVQYLSGSTLAVAFNVKIKKTLEERIGDIATCKTMNGLGHAALGRFFNRKIKIDRDKIAKIITELLKLDENKYLNDEEEAWFPLIKIVGRVKHHGLVPKGIAGAKALVEDTDEVWDDIATHYDIPLSKGILRVARQALTISINMSWKGVCDFDDQIYIPCCWGATFDKFDNVIVDEAQDLSEIQHLLLKKVLKTGGRMIAVGDPFQAIYGWRAASSDSIGQLTRTFDLQELGLTVSFRCAQNIVIEAQKTVERIEFAESAPMGSVSYVEGYDAYTFLNGNAILCRTNAPIIKLAYRLIKRHCGVQVLGRDIGAGLVALMKRLTNKQLLGTVSELELRLSEWREFETEKAIRKSQFSKAEAIADKADSLQVMIEGTRVETLQELSAEIKNLFSKNNGQIILSTIHRAKGLEWEKVFILDQVLMPSKWAVKAYEKDPDTYAWMMQEERNIRYVAVTRAMRDLVYISSEGWER